MFLNNKKVFYSSLFSILFFGLFICVLPVYASSVGFNPDNGAYNVGDLVRVRVVVSSDKSINATSGQILFPRDLLSLSSVSKNGSIINLWAQEPSYSNTSGVISFEGVILNGYSGEQGTILTLIFKAKSTGTANLKFSQASILANDGNGTEVISGKGTAALTIKEQIKDQQIPVGKTIEETVQKEPTEPIKNDAIKVVEITNNTTNNYPSKLLIIILIAIFVLLITVLIIGEMYYLDRLQKSLKNKLIITEKNISKDFALLDSDIEKENSIYSKLRNKEPLTDSDVSSIYSMNSDIKYTESEILKEVKNLEQGL